MKTDDEPLEPLDIDDRSPGERMIASGRAGVGRLGEIVDGRRFDIAALVWMLCTITFVGTEIYTAFRVTGSDGFGGDSLWNRLAALTSSRGPFVAVSCLVGIVLAVLSLDTAGGRTALWLATLGGAVGWRSRRAADRSGAAFTRRGRSDRFHLGRREPCRGRADRPGLHRARSGGRGDRVRSRENAAG